MKSFVFEVSDLPCPVSFMFVSFSDHPFLRTLALQRDTQC